MYNKIAFLYPIGYVLYPFGYELYPIGYKKKATRNEQPFHSSRLILVGVNSCATEYSCQSSIRVCGYINKISKELLLPNHRKGISV